jgi:hypothetical protein
VGQEQKIRVQLRGMQVSARAVHSSVFLSWRLRSSTFFFRSLRVCFSSCARTRRQENGFSDSCTRPWSWDDDHHHTRYAASCFAAPQSKSRAPKRTKTGMLIAYVCVCMLRACVIAGGRAGSRSVGRGGAAAAAAAAAAEAKSGGRGGKGKRGRKRQIHEDPRVRPLCCSLFTLSDDAGGCMPF